ncbi:hypothetical protein [Longispora albida]|uniref:hypothetical protein n=1 Tax=Longispora albida TaxID=203523 RepID=UPI0003611C2F|nr:hypothetical protein [Longispora albida]
MTQTQKSGVHDFEFFFGTWKLINRRRNRDGVWEEFPADQVNERHLDGSILIEHYLGPFPGKEDGPLKAVAVYAFDHDAQLWKIVWLSNVEAPDFTPLVGKFNEDGTVGEFFQDLKDGEGKPFQLRFTWDNITEDSCEWRQCLSYDGVNWDTNWTQKYTRVK